MNRTVLVGGTLGALIAFLSILLVTGCVAHGDTPRVAYWKTAIQDAQGALAKCHYPLSELEFRKVASVIFVVDVKGEATEHDAFNMALKDTIRGTEEAQAFQADVEACSARQTMLIWCQARWNDCQRKCRNEAVSNCTEQCEAQVNKTNSLDCPFGLFGKETR